MQRHKNCSVNLQKNADGVLYRLTRMEAIDNGVDAGLPGYLHEFKGERVKTIALSSSYKDVLGFIDKANQSKYLIYKIHPEDVAGNFTIQIPSTRVDESVIHVHSPKSVNIRNAEVVWRSGKEIQNADQRRQEVPGRGRREPTTRPELEGLQPIGGRERREGLEGLEGKEPSSSVNSYFQTDRSIFTSEELERRLQDGTYVHDIIPDKSSRAGGSDLQAAQEVARGSLRTVRPKDGPEFSSIKDDAARRDAASKVREVETKALRNMQKKPDIGITWI